MRRRDSVLEKIAALISAQAGERPFLVAIDGIDGAGKTTLANDLVPYIGKLGRNALHLSIDGFHNPREVRTAAGQLSPEGYYHDSFDYPSLRGSLLTPLKSAPLPLRLPAAKFDWKSNGAIEDAFVDVFAGTIVLFEGVFLLRSEIRDFWDYRIFVQIRAETSLARGLQRDSHRLGGEAATRERYLKRYLPGQKLYLSSVNPDRLADLVIENDDVEAPVLRVR